MSESHIGPDDSLMERLISTWPFMVLACTLLLWLGSRFVWFDRRVEYFLGSCWNATSNATDTLLPTRGAHVGARALSVCLANWRAHTAKCICYVLDNSACCQSTSVPRAVALCFATLPCGLLSQSLGAHTKQCAPHADAVHCSALLDRLTVHLAFTAKLTVLLSLLATTV